MMPDDGAVCHGELLYQSSREGVFLLAPAEACFATPRADGMCFPWMNHKVFCGVGLDNMKLVECVCPHSSLGFENTPGIKLHV